MKTNRKKFKEREREKKAFNSQLTLKITFLNHKNIAGSEILGGLLVIFTVVFIDEDAKRATKLLSLCFAIRLVGCQWTSDSEDK